MRRLALLSVLAVVGCGGYTDGGDGTNTLQVDAVVTFTEGTALMDARVAVDQHDGFVSGATVTLQDHNSGDTFGLDEDGNFYRAKIAGDYRRELELKVVSGSDKLSAKLEGPGMHFIAMPFDGTTVHLGKDPLKVEWSVKDGIRAQSVTVTTDNSSYRGASDQDRGDVEIPRELLQAGDDVIHVVRANTVKLKHAADSTSSFVISYEALSRVHFDE